MAREILYLGIARALRDQLGSEGYGPGQVLPSEGSLALTFGVSRVTVRKALERLTAEGLIDSRQGFGWFVVAVPLRQSLDTLITIDAQFEAAGRRPERRLLKFSFTRPEPRARAVLGCNSTLLVSRLNLADDEPIGRNSAWVPQD